MATKDYVTRSQNIRKRGKKKQNQVPVNWFRIFLALLLLAGFVYGLYFLANLERSEQKQEKTSADNELVIDSKEQKEKEVLLEQLSSTPLPELQEEQWEYIDSLPDFEVQVDTTGPLESERQYIMQCGSFKTQESAEEQKALLAFQGLESKVHRSDGKNGIWYRVVLGPYDRKRAAERDRHMLRDANIRDCKIW